MKKSKTPKAVTMGDVRELVDEMLRGAFRDQSRDLEKHLGDADRRLRELEGKQVLGR